MKDLQKLLEEKAAKKLAKDAEKYCNLIMDDFLFSAIGKLKITLENGKEKKLSGFFWGCDGECRKIIIKNKLPSYIEAETKNFVEKVDRLSTDIDELRNI